MLYRYYYNDVDPGNYYYITEQEIGARTWDDSLLITNIFKI